MAQVPALPMGYPQQLEQQQPQQQQQQLQGQQRPSYTSGGVPSVGMQVVATPSLGTPGGMNVGTPGTLLPNGQFVPNNGGVPAPAYSTGPPVFAPSPGVGVQGSGAVAASGHNFAPAGGGGTQEHHQQQQQQQYVGVPPGMTLESLQPGYDPRVKNQKRVYNPEWSFRDSFGNRRGWNCCTIS